MEDNTSPIDRGNIHVIAAVGGAGQLGLNNGLPWGYNAKDLRLFRQVTTGGVLIVGNRTFRSMTERMTTEQWDATGRTLVAWNGVDDTYQLLRNVRRSNRGDKPIWICGGAHTYSSFAKHVGGNVLLNFINYAGPADAYFPFQAFNIRLLY